MSTRSIVVSLLSLAAMVLTSCTSLRLRHYTREMYKDNTNLLYLTRRTAELGAPGVRWLLHDTRGSYDGDWEGFVGIGLRYATCDVMPYLGPLLEDKDPRVRGFAARVAGHLLDDRFIPQLTALTCDTRAMPDLWFDRTVADCARSALRAFERKQEHSDDWQEEQRHIETEASVP